MDSLPAKPGILLLCMEKVPYIDATGEAYLANVVRKIKSARGVVFISGLQSQPASFLQKTGLYHTIGRTHFFEHTAEALDYAWGKLKEKAPLHVMS